MTGFSFAALFHNFTAISLWGVWLIAIIVIATRKKWRLWVRLSLIAVLVIQQVVFVVVPMVKHYRAKAEAAEKEKRGIAQYQAWKAKAQTMFDERCKKAGYFVYKQVPKQDSVYIMTPSFSKPAPMQIKDQYWKGDPYTYKQTLGSYSAGFHSYLIPAATCRGEPSYDASGKKVFTPIYQWHEAPFNFIEVPNEKNPNQLMRYQAVETSETRRASGAGVYCTKNFPAYKYEGSPTPNVVSMYGVKSEDISTKIERDNWIAGSRLQIVDLKTGDVVAERIGYLWNWAPNQTMYSDRGWDFTKSCPFPNEGAAARDVNFIAHILSESDNEFVKYITFAASTGEGK